MKNIADTTFSFDLQGLDVVDQIIFLDLIPLGISYMGHGTHRYVYLFLLCFVIGMSWSVNK